MSETLQEKTYRIARETFGDDNVGSFDDSVADPAFAGVCRMVAQAQCEALREAVKLHAFTHPDGNRYILAENLTNWANDIEQGISK